MSTSADLEQLAARLRVVEDHLAIQQLFVDYGDRLDAGDLEGYADCFTADGELMLGPIGRAKGRDEIIAMMRPTLKGLVGNSFHIITNPRVQLNGDEATAVVMWTVVTRGSDGAPVVRMLGRHEDELVRDGTRWRFRRRRGLIDLPSAYPGSA